MCPDPFDEPEAPEEDELEEALAGEIAAALPAFSWLRGGAIEGSSESTASGEEEPTAPGTEARSAYQCRCCGELILTPDDAALPRCPSCASRQWRDMGPLPIFSPAECEPEEEASTMEITLKFTSADEAKVAMLGAQWQSVVLELDEYLKTLAKHGDLHDGETALLRSVRNYLRESCTERGLSLD